MANESTSNGIGFGTVLFLIFMTLKLTGNIDWSWWWVTSPLWIPLTLGVIALCVIGLIAVMFNKK